MSNSDELKRRGIQLITGSLVNAKCEVNPGHREPKSNTQLMSSGVTTAG